METLKESMEFLERSSSIIAEAIIKIVSPRKDDISENRARQDYGEAWLLKMKQNGLAKCTTVGTRKIYSRHQLDCLRAAEREKGKYLNSKG